MLKQLTILSIVIYIGSVSTFGFAQKSQYEEKSTQKGTEQRAQKDTAPSEQTIGSEKAVQERPTHRFNRKWLEEKAHTLAATEYQLSLIPEDNPLSKMSYDDYKKIQFRRAATIWSKEARQFRVNPLHPGFLFKTPVKLNLVVGGISRRILYTSEIFAYDDAQDVVKQSKSEGYSGFSVTTPINNASKWDEFLVFQGGTYFRAVGQTNWYGLSARGFAINTGRPSGEEFPVFTDFWIERPTESADSLVVHALMESKSATGAYTFTIRPGINTEVKVLSTIYPRTDIASFGIAPLTSMFLFNPINTSRFDDFRPAVHDSDGLAMVKNNGERLWRPLANPTRLQVSVFKDEKIQGFGLMQRSRQFQNFEDIEAHYQDRPSAWVTPIGDWGPGHVELLEIPTKQEIHDNIVAFWQPNEALKAGQAYRFAYKLAFGSSPSKYVGNGEIVSTASGLSLVAPEQREYVIDYVGDNIPDNIKVDAIASSGTITGTVIKIVPQTGHLRVIVKFLPGEKNLSELRVSLSSDSRQWGETWLYRWTR